MFPEGTEGRPGLLTEAQQREVDIFEALRVYGQTGESSELVRLGIFSADAGDDIEDET